MPYHLATPAFAPVIVPYLSTYYFCWGGGHPGAVESSRQGQAVAESTENIEPQKRRLLFWFGVLLCVGIAFALNRSPAIRTQSDLFARWYASRQLLTSGRNIYDLRNGQEVARYKNIPTTALEAIFFYPAHLLVFVAPLSLLPFEVAHLIWTIAILLFLFLGIWLVTDALRWPPQANHLAAFILAALLFILSLQVAIWSQFDTLAVLFLALTYLACLQERYFLAGVWLSGLTFKPQIALLTLGMLLLWAALDRKRWRLLLGFGLSLVLLWGIAEALQPGWVGDFLVALRQYQELPYQIDSVLDQVWNPAQGLAAALLLVCVGVFISCHRLSPGAPPFWACLALSLAAWWLVVPIIGMMHLVLMPLAVAFLLAAIQQVLPRWHRPALLAFLLLYILGYAGFIYGLITPGLYGQHIALAEIAYKVFAPLLVLSGALAVVFSVWRRKTI